ncbi:2'-5' RNA ligase family protein [Fulvivirga kasyanovii]|uniref:RNA 2',3'-cyclic phosphodiesterase n=1 Tax=Fulvivirga kasyanovii TaxID=396812 RepID=A0ABW9RT94_9BACT|nr:RNA 2',3'-cyclic phosphodiesterase [Fulvivirga kasyanovii]MTI27398.1 RNA 2',3'-cyclic phosphodiesterase [Fulvivirga kasyanovii]
MKEPKQLYFIAIVPPEPIYSQIAEFKAHMAEQYNSKAALKSPPHITLHMPFRWDEEKEEKIFRTLENLTDNRQAFDLSLENFGAFKPRVIYVDLHRQPALEDLHDDLKKVMKISLNIFNADYKDRGFNPHMTLAFRDLKKPAFFEAWKEFESKEFNASFTADKIILLKHNGKNWDVYREFPLKK